MDRNNFFHIAHISYLGEYRMEDLLTDLLSTFFSLDTQAAYAWYHHITGIWPSELEIISQPPFLEYPQDKPDLRLESPDLSLICEHKIDSSLGPQQLERYLDLVIKEEIRTDKKQRLAFVTKDSFTSVPHVVLDDPHYLRPLSGSHYCW